MSISKTVFTTAFALMMATGIETVKAEETADNAILFKVHDVVPVKNSDSEVIACDFNTTFYNRSPLVLKEASVELIWHDASLENIINAEKKADAAQNGNGRGYSKTERSSEQDIKVMMEVPTLKPYKQATVKERVNTDRCFLLIEKLEYALRTCNVESVTDKNRRKRSGNNECTRLFQFVSPENPQYYQEFKEISVDEQQLQEDNKRREEQDELNSSYTAAVEAIGNTGSIISGIK